MTADRPIFDCHVHLPSPGLGRVWEWAECTPNVASAIQYLRRCDINRVLANTVRGELAATPAEMVAANDEIAQIAANYQDTVVPACLVNTNFPAESLQEIRRCHDELGMVWMGELCGYASGYRYDTPGFTDAIQLATDLNMVIQIHNDCTLDMDRLCLEFPDTVFVLAHLGDSPRDVKARIGLTERHPNLHLDISGHGYQRMGVLELAVRAAGADRVLFGSDYTINDPAGVIARIRLASFDEDTRQKILGGNVLRLLAERGVFPGESPILVK